MSLAGQPRLIIEATDQIFPLPSENILTIGRKSGNTIVLEDDLKVSRHHATISWDESDYILQDLGSSNGTYLNNNRISNTQPLSNGDMVQVGNTILKVHLPAKDTEPSLTLPPLANDETVLQYTPPAAMAPTMLKESTPLALLNPYVGPRTFSQEESDRFFGREHEARELLSLVISERLVLFYAQSGSGKSSLVNTRLGPQLQESGLSVLPIGRVSGELPQGIESVKNIYIFNLLLSLDESDGDPNRLTQMPLTEFLQRLTSLDGRHYFYDDTINPAEEAEDDADYEPTPYVLIIDQFEEVVTTHPTHWEERAAFFKQLDEAMINDPMLWVVLTLREDYIAALNPYTHLMQNKMRARFYMQRMSFEAGLEAIAKPAEQHNRPFAVGVAENLVDNLRQIRVYGAQSPAESKGQYIEPVQLQVVCYQLWENLKDKPAGSITQQDLDEMGNVDESLGQFYEQALHEVVAQTDVTEIELRSWFETELITEAGTRGTVYRGTSRTGGIDNQVVDLLSDKYILRSEVRSGGTWYELVHDRFVEPIYLANQAWQVKQPLIQMAQSWAEADRSPGLLLEGDALKSALDSNWAGLGNLVEQFLTASQESQQTKEQVFQAEKLAQTQALADERQQSLDNQTRSSRRLRIRNMWLSLFALLAIIMMVIAGAFGYFANLKRTEAVNAQLTAEFAKAVAEGSLEELERKQLENEAVVADVATLQSSQNEVQVAIAQQDIMVQETQLALEVQVAEAEAALAPMSEDTPTATPTPFPTPTGTVTPATPTHTPTNTPTATPNLIATATADALVSRSMEVQAAQTAVAWCPLVVEGEFQKIWQNEEIQDRLICPEHVTPFGGYFAEQPFARGYMVWSQIPDIFIVFAGGERSGSWEELSKEQVDSYGGNPIGISCNMKVPNGLVQPIRGFGIVWCARDDISDALGFGTVDEFGLNGPAIQFFEGGTILRDSQNRIYVLFDDDNTYVRVN